MCVVVVGDAVLKGTFGCGVLDGLPDYYNSLPFQGPPPARIPLATQQHLPFQKGTLDLAARRRFLGDGTLPFSGEVISNHLHHPHTMLLEPECHA